jgi:hypothetical protein
MMTGSLGYNLLGAAVVYFFLYESSGLSLEAVHARIMLSVPF